MIRGWCPSLFEPMASGDGLLVRVKPRAGGMDAPTLRGVAEAAARFGNGMVNLTGRANLQMRGLSERTLPEFTAGLLALGAADADPAAERRRNLVTSPLAGDDPEVAAATLGVARALEAGLAGSPGSGSGDPDAARASRGAGVEPVSLDGLPGKFGFVVDGGGGCDLGSVRGDVVVRCAGATCTVRIDGGGEGVAVGSGQAAALALSLARAFLALAGGRAGERRRGGDAAHMSRMRDLVAARGEAAVFAAAGLPASSDAVAARGREAAPDARWIATQAAREPGDAAPDPGRLVGAIRHAGTGRGAFAAAPAFGQTDAAALHALAGLAERFGDGRVRLSPWRTLLVGGVAARDLGLLGEACGALGLIVAAGDPRLAVVTCPGRPRCASGEAATPEDAPALAALLAGRRPGGVVHLSGCAKGCAHPGRTALVLVGEPGGYGVARNGRASDTAERHLATVEAAWTWAAGAAEAGAAGAWIEEPWEEEDGMAGGTAVRGGGGGAAIAAQDVPPCPAAGNAAPRAPSAAPAGGAP
jgi:precorrin-3B synthase